MVLAKSPYYDRVNELNSYISKHQSSFGDIIQLLTGELASLLSSHKKSQTKYTLYQLTLFEEKVVTPYINMHVKEYGVDHIDVVKGLQSIKDQIISQQYTFKTYMFTKQIDDIIKSNDLEAIKGKLRYLEELFRQQPSPRSQTFILQQAEKCINALPSLSQRSLREYKFKNDDPKTESL